MSEPPAPVALFVHARPEHAARVLAALAANRGSGDTELHVFCDGPRDEREAQQVARVRAVVRAAAGFKRVTVAERADNAGLATSVETGVSELIDRYGRVIVLEDDIETAGEFLCFMNRALDAYARQDRVMHVSGYMFPVRTEGLPETFFLRQASCWGWATWRRAWETYSREPERVASLLVGEQRRAFNLDGAYDYFDQIRANLDGRLDTWAVFWYASIFLSGGLGLFPRDSLARNIGHDGSGVHSDRTRAFDVDLGGRCDLRLPSTLEEHGEARARLGALLAGQGRGRARRLLARLRSPRGRRAAGGV